MDEDHPATASEGTVPPKTRILFCSPVAGVGINLSRTKIVNNLVSPLHLAVVDC
jgi:hypothetical protein